MSSSARDPKPEIRLAYRSETRADARPETRKEPAPESQPEPKFETAAVGKTKAEPRITSQGEAKHVVPPSLPVGAEQPVPRPGGYRSDPLLYGSVLVLTMIGVVMVYSASAIYAQNKFGDGRHFLFRELVWVLLGLIGMAVTVRLDYSIYRRLAYPTLVLSILLLISVLLFGARVNGARRWFHLAGLSFQPAELAKLSMVMYLSHSLSKKADKVKLFAIGFAPHLFVCGVCMLLLLKQPDLGTAAILGGVTLLLLFVAGAKISYLVMAILSALPGLYYAIVGTPWRLKRILAYLDPWQFRSDTGYQIAVSLIAIGSGGVWGAGLGDSKQKLFLPEAYSDYILAIVGEELGFFGVTLILSLFAVLVVTGYRTAYRARDAFGCYLACGITTMLGLQAVVNIGVVLGVLPTKGLPLPFVSFGGSTLVIDLLAVGILLNISRGEPAKSPLQRSPSRLRFLSFLLPGKKNRRRPGGGKRVSVSSGRPTQLSLPTRPDLSERPA